MRSFVTFCVVCLCRILHLLMRTIGRKGDTLPGYIALKLYPGILEKLSENLHCICVTGTNGKTTTAHLLSELLKRKFGNDLLQNTLGVNLPQSITFELIRNTDFLGRMKCHYAVIECDEDFMPTVCKAVKPEIVVMTNLEEDQVSRFPSMEYVYGRIKLGLEACGGAALLCANADDTYASRLASEYGGRTLLFGKIGGNDKDLCVSWNGIASDMTEDGFSYSLDVAEECTVKASSSIPGTFNVFNAMAALTAIKAMGMSIIDFASYLKDVLPATSRMETFTIDDIPMRVALVKNKASFDVMADYVASQRCDMAIILAQAAELPDDMFTDWIGKTDLSVLKSADHIKKIFITGKTGYLWYEHFIQSGFDTERVALLTGAKQLVSAIRKSGLPAIWFPCYSESVRLRKVLDL